MRSTRAALAVLLAHRPRHTTPPPSWPQVWWDDHIESGDHWTFSFGEGDCVHAPSADAVHSGTYGLKLKTRVTGAANDDQVVVHQHFLMPTQDYLTLSLWYRLPSKTPSSALTVQLTIASTGHLYAANLLHATQLNKWQYFNSTGAYSDVPAGGYTWPANTWVPLLLRLRVSTQRYGICTLAGIHYDLSAQSLYDIGPSGDTTAHTRLQTIANASAPTTLHADDLVLTHSPNPP